MDAKKQRQVFLLTGLGVVLALLVVFQVLPAINAGPSTPPPAAAPRAAAAPSSGSGAPGSRSRRATGPVTPESLVVHMERLDRVPPDPLDTRRNPFDLRPPAPPPSAVKADPSPELTTPGPMVPTGPPPPPPLPPIQLKFIGVVKGAPGGGKIAVLSDGKFTHHGFEGAIIDGRYRIVSIGEESLQIEYADGRGRQTLRLTGS